jgi:hypothetical protein
MFSSLVVFVRDSASSQVTGLIASLNGFPVFRDFVSRACRNRVACLGWFRPRVPLECGNLLTGFERRRVEVLS